MTIRKCKTEDLAKVSILEEKLFTKPYSLKDLNYELNENPFSNFYVLLDESEVVGYLIFLITFNTSTIDRIAVDKKYQGKGNGQLLMNKMDEILSNKKLMMETCTLEVRKSNLIALNFYKKNKFKEVTIKPHYYDNGEDAIFMVKYYL